MFQNTFHFFHRTRPVNHSPDDTVLTLIAAAQGGLEDALAVAVAAALGSLGLAPSRPDWLSGGEACDITFAAPGLETAKDAVRAALDGAAVDFCLQKAEGRRKKILIADMDSTIITSETLDELAALAGFGPQIAAITKRSMLGEIDFTAAIHERVAMLAGMDIAIFRQTLAAVRLSPGAEILVRTMTAHGAHAALVSGGFENFTGPVAKMAGFDEHHSNRFEIEDDRLTGRVHEPVLGPDAKLETLQELCSKRGLVLSDALAIGDGANDVPMIRAAGLGIAYRGKPIAREAATARIDHAGLTAALFMQGYRQSDFVT
jgi:phosphoserine phosphatase